MPIRPELYLPSFIGLPDGNLVNRPGSIMLS
jgi:hypothetical protein